MHFLICNDPIVPCKSSRSRTDIEVTRSSETYNWVDWPSHDRTPDRQGISQMIFLHRMLIARAKSDCESETKCY